MLFNTYEIDRGHLDTQFRNMLWKTGSGLDVGILKNNVLAQSRTMEEQGVSHPMIKARMYDYILTHAQLEDDVNDWFVNQINHGGALKSLKNLWVNQVYEKYMPTERFYAVIGKAKGVFNSEPDFCHTGFDWYALLDLGVTGLLERIDRYGSGCADEKRDFYESSRITIGAVLKLMSRLADNYRQLALEHREYSQRMGMNAEAIETLTRRPPETFLEALHLTQIFYMLGDEMDVSAIDAMGGLDRLYIRFYQHDIEAGVFTQEQMKEIFKYYLFNIGRAADRYSSFLGHSFHIGGRYADGHDAVNPMTYLILDAYTESAINTPKLSIRVHQDTPGDFLQTVALYIRDKNLRAVICNDESAVAALKNLGIEEIDAWEYAPVGCWEPTAIGKDTGCTGWPGVMLPKCLELTLNQGVDPISGLRFSKVTPALNEFKDFASFYAAFKEHVAYLLNLLLDIQRQYEQHYLEMNPAPLLSLTMLECVQKGIDAFVGGSKYSNSAAGAQVLAETVDSLLAIKHYVFEKKELPLSEFNEILRADWKGHELLRCRLLADRNKWGNGYDEPDELGREILQFTAGCTLNKPNGRGGHFRASSVIIFNERQSFGRNLGALPSGRSAQAWLPPGLCACDGMDREGTTGLIHSAGRVDYSLLPGGSVLDIMLHPSAIQGEDGLIAFWGIVHTYFKKGGFSININVFSPDLLREAQKNPDKYATLQIRVCGWNVYFVNLSYEEQNWFIRRAEQSANA